MQSWLWCAPLLFQLMLARQSDQLPIHLGTIGTHMSMTAIVWLTGSLKELYSNHPNLCACMRILYNPHLKLFYISTGVIKTNSMVFDLHEFKDLSTKGWYWNQKQTCISSRVAIPIQVCFAGTLDCGSWWNVLPGTTAWQSPWILWQTAVAVSQGSSIPAAVDHEKGSSWSSIPKKPQTPNHVLQSSVWKISMIILDKIINPNIIQHVRYMVCQLRCTA